MGAIASTSKRFKLVEEIRQEKQRPSPELAKLIRKQARVSRRRVAEELGIHVFTLVKWETGERRPRGDKGSAYYELLRQLERVTG